MSQEIKYNKQFGINACTFGKEKESGYLNKAFVFAAKIINCVT